MHGVYTGPYRWPGTGQGVTQRARPGNHHPPPAAAPGAQAASSQHHSARAAQRQLSRRVSEQDQHRPRQGRSAPSGRSCLFCREQACHLGLARGQPSVLPSPHSGPTGKSPTSLPSYWGGVHLSWGSRGTTSTLMSERPQCRRSPLEGSPRRRPGSRQKPWCGQQGAPTCRLTWDPPSSQLGRPSSLSGYPQRSSWSESSVHTHPQPLQPPGS